MCADHYTVLRHGVIYSRKQEGRTSECGTICKDDNGRSTIFEDAGSYARPPASVFTLMRFRCLFPERSRPRALQSRVACIFHSHSPSLPHRRHCISDCNNSYLRTRAWLRTGQNECCCLYTILSVSVWVCLYGRARKRTREHLISCRIFDQSLLVPQHSATYHRLYMYLC